MTTAVEAISTPLLIAGEERPGGAGTFPVYDPARAGAIIGYAAAASAADALAAVAAAEAAWPAWAAMSGTDPPRPPLLRWPRGPPLRRRGPPGPRCRPPSASRSCWPPSGDSRRTTR